METQMIKAMRKAERRERKDHKEKRAAAGSDG